MGGVIGVKPEETLTRAFVFNIMQRYDPELEKLALEHFPVKKKTLPDFIEEAKNRNDERKMIKIYLYPDEKMQIVVGQETVYCGKCYQFLVMNNGSEYPVPDGVLTLKMINHVLRLHPNEAEDINKNLSSHHL